MSGRGKGLGKGGAKRHKKVLRDNIQGVTKPAIHRLCRRGGVKRISGPIYEETRGVLKVFMENVLRDAITYCEHSRRKTVTAMDVVYALKRQDKTLYGFGDGFSNQMKGPIVSATRKHRVKQPQPQTQPQLQQQQGLNTFTETERRLQSCKNNLNICLSLGIFSDELIAILERNDLMAYIVRLTRLNVKKANENLIKLTYTVDTKTIKTVFKSMKQNYRNNVVYEYVIGRFLNLLFKRTPNIVPTCNLYRYVSNEAYERSLHSKNISIDDFRNSMVLVQDHALQENVRESCKNPNLFAFEQIFVPNVYTLEDILDRRHEHHDDFVEYYFITTLFQIYAFLYIYQEIFTHNDLNPRNILLTYVPRRNFLLTYDLDGTKVHFFTRYIVKFIDYSQCYLQGTTQGMYDNACAHCGPDCGKSKGFVFDSIVHDKRKDIELLKMLSDPSYRHLRVNNVFDDLMKTHFTTVNDVFQYLITSIEPYDETRSKYILFGTFDVDCSIVRDVDELERTTGQGEKVFRFDLNVDKNDTDRLENDRAALLKKVKDQLKLLKRRA